MKYFILGLSMMAAGWYADTKATLDYKIDHEEPSYTASQIAAKAALIRRVTMSDNDKIVYLYGVRE